MNDNIKRFLTESYLNEEYVGFGILIDGSWGSGKTFIINNIIKTSNLKSYYVSIYGLSTLQQLRDKVYEKLHPIITSKAVKVSSTILKAAAKGMLHFDLDKDGNEDVTFELPLAYISDDDFEKNVESQKVIIIDDIERSSIPAEQVFGFFSEYIIEKGAKVIFICNQDELKKKYKIETTADGKVKIDEYKTKYLTIKEKVIGFDFFIEPDYESAIDSFIKKLQLENIINELKDVVFELVRTYQLKNLRTIEQSFYHIRILYNILKDEKNFDFNVFKSIIRYFEIAFINKQLGNIKEKNDIRKLFLQYINKQSLLSTKETSEYISKIPFEKLYYDMVINGDYDREKIINEFGLWLNPIDNKNYLSVLSRNWNSLTDIDFQKFYKELDFQFNNGEIKSYQELWDYAELILTLSKCQIISITTDELIRKIKNYIEKNKENITSYICPEDLNDMLYYDEETISPLYHVPDLQVLIIDASIINYKKKIANDIKSIIAELQESINPLINFIQGYNNTDYESSVVSIFDYISEQDFYSSITLLSLSSQFKLYNTFESVYREIIKSQSVNLFNQIVVNEIEKLEKISNFYANDSGTNYSMSPEKYEKHILSLKYKKLVETIKKSPDKL